MSTAQYGFRVTAKQARSIELAVLVISEDSELPAEGDLSLFVSALSEDMLELPEKERARRPDPALAERVVTDGGDLFDDRWMARNAKRYVTSAKILERTPEGLAPRFSSWNARKKAFSHEEKLPRARFLLELADGAFADHLEVGDAWESAVYAAEWNVDPDGADELDEAPPSPVAPEALAHAGGVPHRGDRLFAMHDQALARLKGEARQYAAPEQLATRAELEAEIGRFDRAAEAIARAKQEAKGWRFGLARTPAHIAVGLALRGELAPARSFVDLAEAELSPEEPKDAQLLAHLELAAALTLLGDGERAGEHLAKAKRSKNLASECTGSDHPVDAARALALVGESKLAAKVLADKDDDDKAAVAATLLARGDSSAAQALVDGATEPDSRADVFALARFLAGDVEALVVSSAETGLPWAAEERSLSALIAGGRALRAVDYLATRARIAREEGSMASAGGRAMQLSRIDPAVARSLAEELAKDAAALRKEAFIKDEALASLAEAAQRTGIDTAPIVAAAKGPAEKFGVALGLLAGAPLDGADVARWVREAQELGRAAKVTVAGRVALGKVLARRGDAQAARAWFAEAAKTAKKDDLQHIVTAQIACGDETAMSSLKKFQAWQRIKFAKDAGRAGHVDLAAGILEGLPPDERPRAVIACLAALILPDRVYETPLSDFRLS